MFRKRMRKILKRECKRVIFTLFQAPGSPRLASGSPRLASGSPGPPKLLHGEVTSSPGRARLLQKEVTARLGELHPKCLVLL